MASKLRVLAGSAAALCLAATPLVAQAAPDDEIVTLDLYNLTDVHGHIEKVTDRKTGAVKEAGLSAVGCYLDKAHNTNPNSSFTLLGDNIGASPFTSGSLDDNPTIAALNELTPLGSTIGNHEFDLGVSVFKDRVDGANGFTQIKFPYLGSNVHGLDGYLKDYVVWQSPSGVKVAFIGAIAEDVPYKLSPGAIEGVTFSDPIEKITELSKSLKESGEADIVIAMLDDDVKNNYPKMPAEVDGIMGGDTHVPYQFSMVQTEAGSTISAIASGSYTDNLANLQFKYNKTTGKVESSEAILIPAATVAECGDKAEVKAIVDQAVADSAQAGARIVATGMQAFYRGVFTDSEGNTSAGSNRGIESSLGDLAADAMQATIKTTDGTPVDIGLINAGGLRADLIPNENGEITYKDTFAVMPFSNQLGYVTITGADFKQALEDQWKTDLSSQNSRPMLKLGISSNVKYTYDATRPRGQRITSVTIDGEPLDLERKYTVGSVTFLLAGGDTFPSLTAGGPYQITDELDRERFNDYLRDNPGLAPRAIKSSIGINLPSIPVSTGSTISIPLRGLSFSEGPSITKTVEVAVGDDKATAEVNNDLADANANNEMAIITTDGAGQATVKMTITSSCEGEGTEALPVVVNTDFGTVVEASQGLTVTLQCTGAIVPPTTEPSASPTEPTNPKPSATTPSATGKPSANLPKTGSDITTLLVAAMLMLTLGGSLIVVKRHRS